MYRDSMIQWLLFFFIYCFIGWVWETSYVSIRKRQFCNRGFMSGPFLPIYGFGAITMLIVTIPVQDNLVLLFITGLVVATVLEYFTGVVMEAIFKVRYWDYSSKRFNLNGHICLSSSIAWGVSAILIVKVVQVPIADFVYMLPRLCQEMVAVVLSIGVSVDMAMSVRDALDIKEMLMHIKQNNEEVQRMQKRIDVLIAVLDDETQNVKAKIEQIMENRQDEERSYVGRAIEGMKKSFDILEGVFSQFEWKAKDKQGMEAKLELEGIKEKIMMLAAKADIRRVRLGKHTGRLLRRNPDAVSKEYAEELKEMQNLK